MRIIITAAAAVLGVLLCEWLMMLLKRCRLSPKITLSHRRLGVAVGGRSRLPWRMNVTLLIKKQESGEWVTIKIRGLREGEERGFSLGGCEGCGIEAETVAVRAGLFGLPAVKRLGAGQTVRCMPRRTERSVPTDDDGSGIADTTGIPEGVREYMRGDKLSDIHMKLSAKCGKYMVRERMRPTGIQAAEQAVDDGAAAEKLTVAALERQRRLPTAADMLNGAVLFLCGCGAVSAFVAKLPTLCIVWGTAVIVLRYIAKRSGRTAWTACFYGSLLITAAAGAGRLSSQLGRIINAVTAAWFARTGMLTAIMQTEKTSLAAACFFGGAAACIAAMAVSPQGRISGRARLARTVITAATAAAVFMLPVTESAAVQLSEITDEMRYGAVGFVQPDGDLAKGLPEGDAPALEIAMDSPEPMYLHGFLGYGFEDGKWTAAVPSETVLTRRDYAALEAAGTDAQNMALFAAEHDEVRVTVVNTGAADRYMYLPVFSEGAETRFAAALENPAAKSSYTAVTAAGYAEFIGRLPDAYNGNGDGAAALLDRLYKGSFTDVPDGVERILAARLDSELKDCGDAERAAAAIYELLEGCDIGGGDAALEDFIQGSQAGGVMHSASAAVMVFRWCGVPARYAEGYTVDSAAASGSGAIKLTAANMHAWAEYYMEGVGWIPFETSPEKLASMPQPTGSAVGQAAQAYASRAAEAEELPSGRRVYNKIEDSGSDEKDTKADNRTAQASAVAAAVILACAAAFLTRLHFDRAFALRACAARLRLEMKDGEYDISAVDGRLGELLKELHDDCMRRLYSKEHRRGRCRPILTYLHCFGVRKRHESK